MKQSGQGNTLRVLLHVGTVGFRGQAVQLICVHMVSQTWQRVHETEWSDNAFSVCVCEC